MSRLHPSVPSRESLITPRKSWLHAGKPVAEEHQEVDHAAVVTVEGTPYWVRRGYYVPYYDSTSRSKRGAVLEQKKRLFYFAERNIDVVDSHQDIVTDYESWTNERKAIQTHYYASTDTKIRDLNSNERLGALVVGAMINRTARVEQAILMRRAEGLSLEDTVPNGELDDSHIASLKAQLAFYASVLFNNKELVQCVRREGYKPDRDHLIEDIIYETLKAYVQNPSMVSMNTVDKIGYAMEAIDEVANTVRTLITTLHENPNIRKFMQQHASRLQPTLDQFVDTARARAGIKSADPHYSDIHREFSDNGETLFSLLRNIRGEARDYSGRSQTVLLKGLQLISDGAKLIDDMPQARYPMNRHARPGVAREEREATSVEFFEEKVALFMKHRKQGHSK